MQTQQFKEVSDALDACARACDHCASACLHEDDVGMMAKCIASDMDCAQICRLLASYITRGSQFAQMLSMACADVCEACRDECAKHQHQHCQDCAQACRQCADACLRFAKAARAG